MSDDTVNEVGIGADGEPEAAGPDASAAEQAQRALGWLGLRHELVMKLFRLAVEWLDEEPLLTQALDLVTDACNAEAGSVIMLDRQMGDLYFAAANGPVSEDIKHFRMDRNEGIAGWCLESGRVVRIGNVHDEDRWHAEISDSLGFDVRQILAAPIKLHNRVIGCVELINKTDPTASEFLPEDEELIADAAECIGILFALRGGKRSS